MRRSKQIELDIINHYFSFEGKIATLKLVYDTFSELINPNFGDDKIEKLNDKLFSDIQEAVSMLPRGFKLNLNIVIKDFEDYTKTECEDIIHQNIKLAVYKAIKENNKKLYIGWSLIGVGAIIILLSYILRNKDYELWFDLINITGTLFVWEGSYMTFIEKSLETKAMRSLARAINNITIELEENRKK